LQQIDNGDGTPPWLQEDEFLQKYGMHHNSLKHLVRLQDHWVCHTNKKKNQAPVTHQLLFLHYLGKSGSGANNLHLCNMFPIGRGTSDDLKCRCINAIRSLHDSVISWMNYISIGDGTLFLLTYEPQSGDALDYHGCKFQYSLCTIIVNHDQNVSSII
jgi:hypothetical protein